MTVLTHALPTSVPSPRQRTAVLCGIVTVEVLALCIPAEWWGIAALSVVIVGSLFWVLMTVLRGRGESLVLGWILIFPLGYYFLSYPREHSLITFDRVLVPLLLMAACLGDRGRMTPIPEALRKPAIWWMAFLLFAAIAIPRAQSPLNSLRLWLEAFVLPGLLAWYVIYCFEVRRHLPALHVMTCAMTIYVAGIGAAEIVTQQDLLPLPDAVTYVAGDSRGPLPEGGIGDFLIRPNGPFSTNNTFAMNGLVSLFFLLFLKQVRKGDMPVWQAVFHRIAVTAALAEALMPFFRSVLVSLAVVLLVDAFYQHGRRRFLRFAAVLSFGFLFVLLRVTAPQAFEDRTDPENVYNRIAQQGQTLNIFLDHPWNGAGLNNFNDAAQNSKYTVTYKGLDPADFPHSNLGAILAETGLTGFVPFVVSQILFFGAFWKLRRENGADSKLAWKTFLFIFLCYWINGMSLTIAYFGDLNLWYMLALACVYKLAITKCPDSQAVLLPS
jgi:hypothetical protein